MSCPDFLYFCPMHLKKIALLNFKNISQEELALCPGINCLVGDNGAGKTNVVDAVYYLSMCKSSLPMTDGQSIRHGADFFLVEGTYASDAGKRETIVCSFSRKGGKVLKRNGKEYERLSDHVGLIPAVIVSPADSALISDAADERRRYLNAFISQLDRAYLGSVMRYNAVLAERNRLLKTRPDETMLQIYDMQLCEHGKAIHARRQEFAERLQPVAAEYYRILSGEKRFRACLLAHIEKVPCTIILPRKQNDAESELIMPPRNYFEQARLIREAICRNLYTEETIAGAAGVSRENVKSLLSLLIFSSDEQNLLLDVGVPKSTAIKLASADKKTREIFINALVGGKDPQGICALIDKSLSPYQSKKKVKFGIKSSGFLLNSINHAVETMREGGMDIGFTTKENDVSTVLTLTVPKEGENVPRGTSK